MQKIEVKVLDKLNQKRLKNLRKKVIREIAILKRQYFYCELCDDYHFPDLEIATPTEKQQWDKYQDELAELLKFKKLVVNRLKS